MVGTVTLSFLQSLGIGGGALEIQAFAVKFGLPVVLYQHGLPIEVYNKGSWKENALAVVALYFESGHYSFLQGSPPS